MHVPPDVVQCPGKLVRSPIKLPDDQHTVIAVLNRQRGSFQIRDLVSATLGGLGLRDLPVTF